MGPIDRRGYDPRAFSYSKIEGEKFGMLTAEEVVGFFGKQRNAVWRFRCDCGKTCEKIASHVVWASKNTEHPGRATRLHCGCQNKYKRHGLNGTKVYFFWRQKRHKMCPEWRDDLIAFDLQCYSKRKEKGKFLVRNDYTKPLGPDNFHWMSHTEKCQRTLEECAELLAERDGVSVKEAMDRLLSVSRQRRQQIRQSLLGVCVVCGSPPSATSKQYCERCRVRTNTKITNIRDET